MGFGESREPNPYWVWAFWRILLGIGALPLRMQQDLGGLWFQKIIDAPFQFYNTFRYFRTSVIPHFRKSGIQPTVTLKPRLTFR